MSHGSESDWSSRKPTLGPGPDGGSQEGVPRFVATARLPSVAYVPGRTVRPPESPAGEVLTPTDWRTCRPYLWGIDLFNHGYYWEAHESWEAVWLAAGRRGPTADFLKGLIKLTAAFVTARQGRPIGVVRHARRARALFQALAVDLESPAVMMGLSLEQLIQEATRVADAPELVVNPSDVPVLRVTRFIMRLDTGTTQH